MSNLPILYTIGYSAFTVEEFIKVLTAYAVTALVDVRAVAASSHFDCYNEANIKPVLGDKGIKYLHMGKELGARPKDRLLYTNGRVDFQKLAASADFLGGCQRLKNGLDKGHNICLMCAQKDPLNCHRAVLITNYFRNRYPDTLINHIWPQRVETQQDIDKRLVDDYKRSLYQNSLIASNSDSSRAEVLANAYAKRGEEIAWQRQ